MSDARGDDDLFRFASLDDTSGPALPLSREATDALVTNVLDASMVPPTPTGAGGGVTGGKIAIGLAALALLGGSAAYIARSRRIEQSVTEAPAPIVSGGHGRGEDAPRAPTPEIVEAPAPAVDTEIAEVVAERTAERPRVVTAPAESAADLLAEANRLRRTGAYGPAEAAYRRVVQTNPRAREAHVARVAAAGLRLDRLGDPSGAASLYREAMRGRGALAAEATFGYARAERALGDRSAEAHALRTILERHPTSPYVRPATERLRALGVVVPSREGE